MYKIFRLYSKDGDSIDIEMEIRRPKPILRPLDANRKIVAQEVSEDGYITKLMMTENEGVLKEYWIEEKKPQYPSSKGKRLLVDAATKGIKKLKETGDVSDKNTLQMLRDIVNKKQYRPNDEFLILLAKTKVEEVESIKRSSLITVESTEPLPSAFKKLIDNNILSVPVLLQDKTYYGFLDISDIVSWVVDQLGEEALDKEDIDFDQITAFQQATVKQAMTYPISKKNPFHPFIVGSSLLSVMEELARGTHRIPVLTPDSQLVTILTQSSVLRFIEQNITLLGEMADMPLEDMYLCNQYVLSLSEDDRAIDAFRLIKLAKVGAVAVLNDGGQLVGNCSAKDLKKISSNSRFLARLFRPLKDYLDQPKLIIARRNETLATALHRIVKHELHRIYILDEEMKPEGVLSLTDIIHEIIK